jgi:hypothetical protein
MGLLLPLDIKVKLFLCLTKYYTMKAYGGVDVEIQARKITKHLKCFIFWDISPDETEPNFR